MTTPTTVHMQCQSASNLAALMVGLYLVRASVLTPEPASFPARHPAPPSTAAGRMIARPPAFLAQGDGEPTPTRLLANRRLRALTSEGAPRPAATAAWDLVAVWAWW